jgi:hypothetical protein
MSKSKSSDQLSSEASAAPVVSNFSKQEEASPATKTSSADGSAKSKGTQRARKSKRGSKRTEKRRSTPLSKKTLSIVTNLEHQAKMLPKARGTESEDEAEAELEEQEQLARETQSLLNAQQWVQSQEANPALAGSSLARSINRSGRGPVVKILMLGDSGSYSARPHPIFSDFHS